MNHYDDHNKYVQVWLVFFTIKVLFMGERVAEYSNIQMKEQRVGDSSFKCLLCCLSFKTTLLLADTYN